jgi:hypothetical protein
VEDGDDPPVLLGGYVASALADRPEVRALVRYVTGSRAPWGIAGAGAGAGNFVPARTDLGVSICASSDPTVVAANAVRVRLCAETHDAIAADNWRFDATDLMPSHIGSIDEDGNPGVVYQAMTEYVANGAQGIGDVLAQIEAAWP